jgi:hypothetical protein
MIRKRSGPWTLHCPPAQVAAAETIAHLPSLAADCREIWRDDAHSFVGVLAIDGVDIVAKSPRHKDRRAWIRWTTLYRAGLAVRVAGFMDAARSAGLTVAEPVVALERRHRGMIIESWLCYRRLPGEPCTARELPLVIATLRRLHALGWIHGDAHMANFLTDGSGAAMLDAEARRKRFGRIDEAYEYIRLRNSLVDRGLVTAAEADALTWPVPRASLAFRIAVAYDGMIHAWRAFKRGLRGGRP